MQPPAFLNVQFLVSALTIVVIIHVILIGVVGCIYAERKISAYIQDRIGPNRVGFDFGLPFLQKLFRGFGFWGLGQALADGLKFILKEDFTPKGADKILFTLAPMAAVTPALIGFAIIPWGGIWHAPDITLPLIGWTLEGGNVIVAGAPVNVGIIFLLAVASLGVYGITLGGWASNNKYSFLGGLRCSAQMISYEIPMGLALLSVLLVVGTLLPNEIVKWQADHGWLIFAQPLAAGIFFIAALAEANRLPFDNAEAEQELVGGYHTEYASMRFALFFLAEYAHVITSSAFFALLFLGGYHLPFIGALSPDAVGLGAVFAKVAVYLLKVTLLIGFIMVIRWTIPRLRFDQVMQVAWQAVIPMGLVILVSTAVMVYFEQRSLLPLLGMNIVLAAIMLAVQPMLPRSTRNRKVRLAGSRFSPLEGEVGDTRPTLPLALEDRPMEGTAQVFAAR